MERPTAFAKADRPTPRRPLRRLASAALLGLAVAGLAVAAGCGGSSSGGGSNGGGSNGGSNANGGGTPVAGGNLVIARSADSESMDATTVFDNESIWIFEQIYQMLYTVSPNGKGVVPQLATSYTLSPDKKTYTFTLRKGVKFSNGQPMTSADVVFSIDQARKASQGWGYIDGAIKDVKADGPGKVIITTKYPWAPLIADIALFSNGIVPKNYAGQSKDQFYQHPIGTGPFMWAYWHKGSALKLVKNPHYWEKGKPYLDSVTWTYVGNTNTRQLQLQGGQVQIDEFPPFSTVAALQANSNVDMDLFNSTRTDYLMMNERVPQLADVHVRRAISYAIDRNAMVHAVLFGHGQAANSFMPPQVPYYDKASPGLQFNVAQAKAEMAKSNYPNGFSIQLLLGGGNDSEKTMGQLLQDELKQLGINVTFNVVDPNVEFTDEQDFKYQLGFSYWTMDIADPDELVSFAVDPSQGAKSFYTDYSNANVIKWTHEAERTFDTAKRQQLYSSIQRQAAQDAFMGFLFYSPYAYATSKKVHGFYVYPTGNYHMENVWLSK
jgi:peptide/nickel transport system substrate-binding protein